MLKESDSLVEGERRNRQAQQLALKLLPKNM